jgi:site-specific DNA-methyltransferase (adenine-specific)
LTTVVTFTIFVTKETKIETKTKIQTNKFYHADCLDILKDLPEKSVDLVLTDPPYKISQKYGGGVDADNLIAVSLIIKVLPEISRVLKDDRFAVIFYDNRILPFLFEAIKGTKLTYRKQIFLYRRWGIANRWIGWMQTTDPVCIFVNGFNKPFTPKLKGEVKHDFYIKSSPEKENCGHPAQKPVEITQDLIFWLSDENEIILDCFSGSGTTAIACHNLNRRFICIEKDKEYFDKSVLRYENHIKQLKLGL